VNIDDINKKIRENTPKDYLDMLKKGRERVIRRRPRDKSEQDLLDKICKEALNQAVLKRIIGAPGLQVQRQDSPCDGFDSYLHSILL